MQIERPSSRTIGVYIDAHPERLLLDEPGPKLEQECAPIPARRSSGNDMQGTGPHALTIEAAWEWCPAM